MQKIQRRRRPRRYHGGHANSPTNEDRPQHLIEQVQAASAARTPLRIRGGDTKAFLGEPVQGQPLDTRDWSGIVSHEPTELVITVRAGTPLAEVEAALADKASTCRSIPHRWGYRAPPSAAWSRQAWPARPGPRWAACATSCWAPSSSTAGATG